MWVHVAVMVMTVIMPMVVVVLMIGVPMVVVMIMIELNPLHLSRRADHAYIRVDSLNLFGGELFEPLPVDDENVGAGDLLDVLGC